jgi:hypothetical protein
MCKPEDPGTTTHVYDSGDQTGTSGNTAGHAESTLAQVVDEPLGNRLRTALEVGLPIKARLALSLSSHRRLRLVGHAVRPQPVVTRSGTPARINSLTRMSFSMTGVGPEGAAHVLLIGMWVYLTAACECDQNGSTSRTWPRPTTRLG